MEIGKFTPELIAKRRWRFKNLVRKKMNERFEDILNYAGYTTEDLACLLGLHLETIEKYKKDCTKIPVNELLLISRLCNVQIDYFPDMNFYLNLELNEIRHL